MAIAFVGDLIFTKLLGSEPFKTRFSVSHSMADYRVLLPGSVQYLVVGSLSAMLSDLQPSDGEPREPRELSISKYDPLGGFIKFIL
jgi:hypothetical protein